MTVKEQLFAIISAEGSYHDAFLLGARTALEAAARECDDNEYKFTETRRAIRSLAEHPERLLEEK